MAEKKFFIPQFKEETESNSPKDDKPKKRSVEAFVSPIYGKNISDNDYYPGVKYANNGRQYDSFRDTDKRVVGDDYKDYIINKQDIFENHKPRTNNPKSNIDSINAPGFEQTIISKDEPEKEVYPNEKVEQEEFVSVKQENINTNNNPFYQQNLYVNQTSPQQYNQNNQYENQDENITVVVEPEQKFVQPKFQNQEFKQTIKQKRKSKYIAPPLNVLKIKPKDENSNESDQINQRNIIDITLKNFGVPGHVVAYTKGPTVTQFEVQLDDGVRNQKIANIQSNIQGNLCAESIRMQIPIPRKSTIGIEVPNTTREMVLFGDMINNKEFLNDGKPLNVILGVNISGEPVYLNIPEMPHGLIGGATGSGKSVCINTIITSILYKAHPEDVKLILIDPKRVEFAKYAGIPHLATPIITEPKMANSALKWAVEEMENRYRLFEAACVSEYSEYIQEEKIDGRLKHIPYLVIIIDELADLMMTSGPEVEESIMRITQKARAAGIHLIVATQRPSVNIISGTIKTNIPTKIAFKVGKSIDSNIILDKVGAEKLLSKGDMLYIDASGSESRIQGAFISGQEIKQVVSTLEQANANDYLFTEEDLRKKTMVDHSDDALQDELFMDIARYVVMNKTASINLLTKKFGCGFQRIQSIIIKLGELGVVSENLGSRAREVLVDITELEEILNSI